MATFIFQSIIVELEIHQCRNHDTKIYAIRISRYRLPGRLHTFQL
jgi:hypothetical protein